MQSEYGICQQMTYCIHSYMHCSVFRLQMSYAAQTRLNYPSWCQRTVQSVYVCLLRIWHVFVCTVCVLVCCCASAYELYIHIQMLPSSSKALITNSQCLR